MSLQMKSTLTRLLVATIALIALFLASSVMTKAKANTKVNTKAHTTEANALPDWTKLDKILDDAIASKAFPGCVALVADEKGPLYVRAKGHNIYPGSSRDIPLRNVDMDTLFDMASVTKVLMSTSAMALLYQNGYISSLELKVSQFFPEFAQNGKETITLAHLLLHNSGLNAGPNVGFSSAKFGCPETSKKHPELAFSCLTQIFEATMAQKLVNPIGAKYVYSDLSMITLKYVIGLVAKRNQLVNYGDLLPQCIEADASDNGKLVCYYEAFVRRNVIERLKLRNTFFITSQNVHLVDKSRIVPAWNDTSYRKEIIHGYVSDGNAYALGGISGHAGMFSDISDVATIMHNLLFPSSSSFLKKETIDYFTKIRNVTQSSRAYGWDTNSDAPAVGTCCGTLAPETFMHTGYTGTLVCGDPKRKLMSILLTNRVYPDPENRQILGVRTQFNTAVQQLYDQL